MKGERVDEMESYELVNHPKHYNDHPTGVEAIDIIEAFNFNIGNAIKYLWRVGLKPDSSVMDDLQKALWYVEREIQRTEKNDHRQGDKDSD